LLFDIVETTVETYAVAMRPISIGAQGAGHQI